MFSIKHITENGFDKLVLKDIENQTSAEVIPSCGAILHSFGVIKEGSFFNVIKSYQNADEFRGNVEKLGFLGCKLSPFVCRIKNGIYKFGEYEYKLQKFYLGKNALHGLVYDQSFEVLEEEVSEQMARVKMIFEYKGVDAGYPFSYDCIVSYELEKNNRLNIITEIQNRTDGLLPVQDGWHPYFTLGDKIDECQLEFQSKEKLVFDEQLLPTGDLMRYEEFGSLSKIGTTSFDNCFTLDFTECQPMCVLRNSNQKIEIEIFPDKSYPYLQLYTPPERDSIAIENLSSAPDAFNNKMGLNVLQAGESIIFKTSYKINVMHE